MDTFVRDKKTTKPNKRIPVDILGQLLRFAQPRAIDLYVAFALFCAGALIGALYVFLAQSSGKGSFYEATIAQSHVVGSLIYPYGFFFGTVAALAYGIFRLGMGRLISALGVVAFMISPNHLYNLVPSILRDYIKAPFILGAVLIMGLMVVESSFKRMQVLVLSGVCGIIVGIGMWFRSDLRIIVPLFVLLVFFFLPDSILANLKVKAAAVSLFMVGILFLSPLLYQEMPSGSINIAAGFVTSFDARLAVTRPAYDLGHQYLDEFTLANSYAQVKADALPMDYAYSSDEYEQITSKYILKVVKNFPADTAIRTVASTLKVLELPFTYMEPPVGITNGFVVAVYSWRAIVLGWLAGFGLFITLAALLIISARGLRQAYFALFFLVYFAGFPSLQFQGRHYFHLEFIGLWFLGALVQSGIFLLGRWRIREVSDRPRGASSALRVLVFAGSLLFVLIVPMSLLRLYQADHVRYLFREYASAEAERLPLMKRPVGRGKVLITSPGQPWAASPGSVDLTDYLVAVFKREGRDQTTVWPTLNYAPTGITGRPTFSRTVSVNMEPGQAPSRLFFPALSYNNSISGGFTYFEGLVMSKREAGALLGLYRLSRPGGFPLVLTATIPVVPGALLYQTLGEWEADRIYRVPAVLPVKTARKVLEDRLLPVRKRDITFLGAILKSEGDRWVGKGYATPQRDFYNSPTADRIGSRLVSSSFADLSVGLVDTDLMMTKSRRLRKGAYLVAEGRLFTGGLTFGLIKDGLPAGHVAVTSRGPFAVVIKAPEAGLYSFGLANNLDGYTSLENRFVVTKLGWVD